MIRPSLKAANCAYRITLAQDCFGGTTIVLQYAVSCGS
jgi:hypothetical protein